MERLLGAFQLSEAHENLTERRQRYRKAATGANLLLQRRASFGQRERVFVAMLNQRNVGLVITNDAEHILRLRGRRQALGLSKRGRRFLDAAALRQHHAGERVDEREIATVARRMKGRRRFGNVLADDSGIADLLVAEPELVMCQTNCFGIMRELGLAK